LFWSCYIIIVIFTAMNHITNPVSILKEEWVSLIRAEARTAELQKKLTNRQLELIYEQQWFKILVPNIYGGKQMPLPDVLQLEESLAYADGSLGWVVTLCAGAGWFGGHIAQDTAHKLLADNKICLAGSGAPGGKAERTDKGYVVNGSWQYATGANDATAFTANCIITSKGEPVRTATGEPEVLSFIFLKTEVTIEDTWNAMGMLATATNSFTVTNLAVASDRTFSAAAPLIKTPLYQFPFKQLAECTLSINLSGMALYFIELCEQIFGGSKRAGTTTYALRPMLKDNVDSHLQKLHMARQKLFYAVDMSWQICMANKAISPSVLYKVSAASFTLTRVVRESVSALYQYCGLDAADTDSEINRVLRNILTCGQHSMLTGDGSA